MKHCPKCKSYKPFSEFPKNRRNKDGYHSSCKVCHSDNSKLRYQKKRSEILEYHKKYYQNNKDKKKAYDREYYLRDKNRKDRHNKNWWLRNREKMLKAGSLWKRLNRDKVASYQARRRSSTLMATPKWLTESQIKDMECFYWLARDLSTISGEPYHVDHIVPLQGKTVCGLHVPWNLQVLPADINLAKHNKHE